MTQDAEDVLTVDALESWLLEVGAAEKERGYGHFCAEDLAHLMLSVFDIRRAQNDGSEYPAPPRNERGMMQSVWPKRAGEDTVPLSLDETSE